MVINKKWLTLIGIQLLFSAIFVLAMSAHLINSITCGILYTFLIIPQLLVGFKENRLFTPITPCFILEISFAFYMMKFVKNYEDLPLEAMLMICFCMFIWKFVSISNTAFRSSKEIAKINTAAISDSSFKLVISVLFLMSAGAMLFEWKMAGGIPALRNDSETFRFSVSYSAITHLLAIMNKVVATLIGIYLVNKERIYLRRDFLLIIEMFISEFLMVGTSMRGEMIMAPCVIFVFYAVKHNLPVKFYVIAGGIALGIVGILPYVRMLNSYGNSYIWNMKSISTYPQYYMFTPLYQSFTNNFKILNLDLSIFPQLKEFGYGAYSILPEVPFVDLGHNIMNVQNEVLNNNFYSGLTATFFASWYADFGYFGFVFVTIIYTTVVNIAYKLCVEKKNLFSFVWYAYTFYSALWIFYNGTINFVYVCYSLIIWFVLRVRIKN